MLWLLQAVTMAVETKTAKGPGLLTPIVAPLSMAVTVSIYLITTILVGSLLDFCGYLLGWWGVDHQLNVLAAEIQYLGDNFTVSVFGQPPVTLALSISREVQYHLCDVTYYWVGTVEIFHLSHAAYDSYSTGYFQVLCAKS